MFKKKFSWPPTGLLRSSQLSDLTFVCQDGVTHAHQFVLEKHSHFLKKFFTSQSTLVGVALNQPIVKGLPATLKVGIIIHFTVLRFGFDQLGAT
jgi:hypothetical protein